MRVAEAEFAFRLGRDLPPRPEPYSVDEALAAVDTLHTAIELPDSRYEDFTIVGAPQLIADNACAHLFVIGPATTARWREIDLANHRAALTVRGKQTHYGQGANVLGDPRIALAWLVNELSGLDITLETGQIVTRHVRGAAADCTGRRDRRRLRASGRGFGPRRLGAFSVCT